MHRLIGADEIDEALGRGRAYEFVGSLRGVHASLDEGRQSMGELAHDYHPGLSNGAD